MVATSPSLPTDTAQAVSLHLDLFVQVQGRSDTLIVSVPLEARVMDLLAAIAARGLVPTGTGEVVLSLCDADDPVDHQRHLHEVGIGHHHQVHCHRRTRIEVVFRFAGQVREHTFASSATFRRLHSWATGPHGFRLSEVDASEHILQVASTGAQPEPTDHLGTVVGSDCRLVLDLVPKHRIEG